MKYVWLILRLLLPVAAIVLFGLHLAGKGGESQALLLGGLLCSSAGLWVNLWFQRKARKERENE